MKKLWFRMRVVLCLPTIPLVLAVVHAWDVLPDWWGDVCHVYSNAWPALKAGEKV